MICLLCRYSDKCYLFCRKVFFDARAKYEKYKDEHSTLFGSCKKKRDCIVNSKEKKEETKVMANPCSDSENEGFKCVPRDVCDNVHLFYDGSDSFNPRLTKDLLRSGMLLDFIRPKDWYDKTLILLKIFTKLISTL